MKWDIVHVRVWNIILSEVWHDLVSAVEILLGICYTLFLVLWNHKFSWLLGCLLAILTFLSKLNNRQELRAPLFQKRGWVSNFLIFIFSFLIYKKEKKNKNWTNCGLPRVVGPTKQYSIHPIYVSSSATIEDGFVKNCGPPQHKRRSAYCDADALRVLFYSSSGSSLYLFRYQGN